MYFDNFNRVIYKIPDGVKEQLSLLDINFIRSMIDFIDFKTGELDNCLKYGENKHFDKLIDLRLIYYNTGFKQYCLHPQLINKVNKNSPN